MASPIVQDRRVDIICGADEITLVNREQVSFSIPIFPGGVSALVRADADRRSSDALEERPQAVRAVVARHAAADARASHVLRARRFGHDGRTEGEHRGATADRERAARSPTTTPASPRCARAGRTCCSAIARNCCRRVQRSSSAKELRVLTRHFTFVALALALRATTTTSGSRSIARCRTFTRTRSSARCTRRTFGPPDTDTVAFFRNVGVPVASPIGPPK